MSELNKTTENSNISKEQDSSVNVKTPLVDALRSYFEQQQQVA